MCTMADMDCECNCFSDERSMLIEQVRKSGIVAFNGVSEIIRWISNEVGFRMIGGELANINKKAITKPESDQS